MIDDEWRRSLCQGRTRAFTIAATIEAASLDTQFEIINIASGISTALADVLKLVAEITGRVVPVQGRGPHPGDVSTNDGAIVKATRLLGYHPRVGLADGLRRQWRWLEEKNMLTATVGSAQ